MALSMRRLVTKCSPHNQCAGACKLFAVQRSSAATQYRSASMLVNGETQEAKISVHDLTFIRGDGAFEVVSLLPSPNDANVGVPIGVKLHLDRLEGTCKSLRLPLAHDASSIAAWMKKVGQEHGPGSVRIIITRGAAPKGVEPQCIMLHDAPPKLPPALRLKSMAAPWHIGYSMPFAEQPPAYSDPVDIDAWHTIKWMSYAPNCMVTRIAQEKGADEALLLAADGRVLDGPTFAVGVVIDEKLRFISADGNHMLPSCTQAMSIAASKSAGLSYSEGSLHRDELKNASAVFAMSATRHVCPVGAIDDRTFNVADGTLMSLQQAYWELAHKEIAQNCE